MSRYKYKRKPRGHYRRGFLSGLGLLAKAGILPKKIGLHAKGDFGFTMSRSLLARKRRAKAGYLRKSGYYGRFSHGGEHKFFDLTIDQVPLIGPVIILTSMTEIAQGTGESQRIGRKMTVIHIGWKFEIEYQASIVRIAEQVRVIIYLDTQCNGTVALATDIMETPSNVHSFRNLANKDRFQILMDRDYIMQRQAGPETVGQEFPTYKKEDVFFKDVNIPIEYDSTLGSLAEHKSNNLGILVLTDNGGITNLRSKLRIRFKDS